MRWLLLIGLLLAAPARADIMDEPIGPVRRGMTDHKVERGAGKPVSKTKPEMSQALGTYEKTWEYPGVWITFDARTKTGRYFVRSIHVTGGTWKTKRGIAIGAARAAVEKAYAKVMNKEESGEGGIVVGSVYGGLSFQLVDDKVTEIYMGGAF